MDFENLLKELDTLAKAQPADVDDKKVVAAAEEAGVADDKGTATPGDATATPASGSGEGEGKEKPADDKVTKSFQIQLENGETVDAIDGTELVKALTDKVDAAEAKLAKAEEFGAKAIDLIKSQGQQIANLTEQVKRLADQPGGRKAVLIPHEKPSPMAKAHEEPSRGDILAKAEAAHKAGKLTALDVSRVESYQNRGLAVPADVAARIEA